MEKVESGDRIKVLQELQKVDRKLTHLAEMSQREPRRLKDAEDKVATEEARLKDLDARHSAHQRDISRKELDVKGRQEKINKLKGQLLAASSNKEYQALTREISLEEAEKSKVEDQILEMMIGVEEFAKEEAAIKAGAQDAKKALEGLRAEVNAAMRDIKAEEAALLEERKAVAARLDPETLSLYNRVFRSRGGQAVVPARYERARSGEEAQYICTGCFMPLTHQMVNLLMLGRVIVTCKSCGRILYEEAAGETGKAGGK